MGFGFKTDPSRQHKDPETFRAWEEVTECALICFGKLTSSACGACSLQDESLGSWTFRRVEEKAGRLCDKVRSSASC